MAWQAVIGLEVHVQLNTQAKLFSTAATAYGAAPNTQATVVDLGLPGVLPTLNQAVVKKAILFALGTHSTINKRSVFARKNYFYPDLPKGYQISQFEQPIVSNGFLAITDEQGNNKRIGITRAHLEEDAGKSIHDLFPGHTAIDLNRAGTPLLEVVSEPDMHSAAEAVAYLKTLHSLVCYLDICDGNMQEGSFRVDANVSVRPAGSNQLGTRSEVKNINSFRFVEKAINYEIERQIELLSNGEQVVQETRLYNPQLDVTRSMRSKEDADDYRYFPDPDLLPLVIEQQQIDSLQRTLPELPATRKQRYQDSLSLSADEAGLLTQEKATADYFEALLAAGVAAKLASNWLLSELFQRLHKSQLSIAACPVAATQLAQLLNRIADNTISNKMAKTVLDAMWQGEGEADEIIAAKGLQQVSDSAELEQLVEQILSANPEQIQQYFAGKEKVFGFFVGQIMKASQGKANPQQVSALLKNRLQQL